MAGDWIKMRTNLWDDPRVSQLCDLTSAKEATVIGALYWLWAAGDEHSEDGAMPGLSVATIDRKTGVKGLGVALVKVGWIAETDDGILIERFDEHNGASAKKRALTARRVANHRSGNADVTPEPPNGNAASVNSALAREEKRREEEKDKGAQQPPDTQPSVARASVEGQEPTPAGRMCRAMRQAGMQAVNPGDPRLIALVDQGATEAEFVGLAGEAVAKGKGFAWVLVALEARRRDAATVALAPQPTTPADDPLCAEPGCNELWSIKSTHLCSHHHRQRERNAA